MGMIPGRFDKHFRAVAPAAASESTACRNGVAGSADRAVGSRDAPRLELRLAARCCTGVVAWARVEDRALDHGFVLSHTTGVRPRGATKGCARREVFVSLTTP